MYIQATIRFHQKWSHRLIELAQKRADKYYELPAHHRQPVVGSDGMERVVPRHVTNVNQRANVKGCLVFPNYYGEKLNLNKLARQWRRWSEAAGLPVNQYYSPHSGKNSLINRSLMAGVTPTAITSAMNWREESRLHSYIQGNFML